MKLYKRAAIARVLGMEENEIRALVAAGKIKRGITTQGLFRLEETAQEVIAAFRGGKAEQDIPDLKTEKARLARIQVENAQIELDMRRGELHRADDIEYMISKILVNFKSRVRAIPSKAAPILVKIESPEEVADILTKLTNETLEELSDLDGVLGEEHRDG